MRVAVLGATGLVGRAMLQLLEGQDWLDGPPRALASPRSAGVDIAWRDATLRCEAVDGSSFRDVDVALFSAGGEASRRWAPVAVDAGAKVVDNSSAWRMDDAVPLVVPEINGLLAAERGPGIIANPNCSTIQVAMAVAPVFRICQATEVHVTTLQAVSGAGQKGVDELARQQAGGEPSADVFPRPIAANAIPAIGPALPDGSFEEEAKVVRELRKILGCGAELKVSCTATRVPVVNGHSAALRIVCGKPVDLATAAQALAAWPGIEVAAGPHDYLTPREISGRTVVHVGRLRRDPEDERALLCWVVADNLLKGAAWNAVQIAALVAAGTEG
jgi:aspartate-semialdehyde dehydrogenase